MVRTRPLVPLLLGSSLAFGATTLAPDRAEACGGFVFEEIHSAGGMAGQQIFVAFTPEKTVVVASVTYAHVSGDVAFLIPLAAPPLRVVDGDPYVFDALDYGTAPRFAIQEMDEEPARCGRDDIEPFPTGAGGDGGARGDADLYDAGTTATYDYVVVGGETGQSIGAWLEQEGFTVGSETRAALDPYLEKGWLFLAARLTAGADRESLAPLQLELPSTAPENFAVPFAFGAPSLPADETLDLTLYLVGEGTLVPTNYESVQISLDQVYAVSEHETNYGDLFDNAVTSDHDGTLVIEYATAAWDPARLTTWIEDRWYGPGGEGPPAGVDEGDPLPGTWFHGANPGGALTRLRTRLGADQLRDMTFEMGADLDVTMRDTVSPRADSGCRVQRRGAGPLLLLGLWLALRRRRPTAAD